MVQVKFMRAAALPTFSAANHNGVIFFDTKTLDLYMGQNDGWKLYSRVKDAKFDDNKLKVTYDGSTWKDVLDFTSGSFTIPAAKVTFASEKGLESKDVASALDELASTANSYELVEDKQTTNYSSNNVLKRYRLEQTVDGVKTYVGDAIEIMKDRSLEEVTFENQQLKFKYNLADGSQTTVAVDVSAFLTEEEYKDGLSVADHVISVKTGDGLEFKGTDEHKPVGVKIDSASEKFLTVGANGVKLSGVQDAINTAKAAATTVVTKASAASHLTVSSKTDSTSGATTYTIGETNIASDSDLTAEVTRAKAAEKELADKIGLTGDEKARTWTPTTNYGDTSATVKDNMQALDTQVKANADAIDNLGSTYKVLQTAKTDTTKTQVVTAISQNTQGVISATKAYAGAMALTQNDAPTGGRIAATDTINAAFKKLDEALLWIEA